MFSLSQEWGIHTFASALQRECTLRATLMIEHVNTYSIFCLQLQTYKL